MKFTKISRRQEFSGLLASGYVANVKLLLNLSGREISNVVFENLMPCKFLRHANFTGCAFKGCPLDTIRFDYCSFDNCTFEKCDFTDTDMSHTGINGCLFTDCSFGNSLIGESLLVNTVFQNCDFGPVRICGGRLSQVLFNDCRTPDLTIERSALKHVFVIGESSAMVNLSKNSGEAPVMLSTPGMALENARCLYGFVECIEKVSEHDFVESFRKNSNLMAFAQEADV